MKRPTDLYIITTAKKRDDEEWDKELIPFLLYPKETAPIKIVIDSWQNLPKYANVMNSFFIFDEQRLVSYGKWTKTFLRISKHNKWILLSATPADKWEDLAPIFIANGFYQNITEFRHKHCVYNPHIVKWRQIDHYVNQGRLRKLRELIYVDIAYSNERVKHDEKVSVAYDKDIYKTVVRSRWNIFEECPIENVSQFCYILRKIVNSDNSRAEAIKDILKDHPRAIIFYNFDYELDILRRLADELNICKAEWNGHLHQPVPSCAEWLYLVQYTAGAEGWNCITTNTIIFYSQSYSYKTMVQASGRIDRRNSPFKDLYFYHLVSKAPLDLAISKALAGKKQFNERTFYKPDYFNSQKKHSI
jgi:superfamily II DNA or RNA helicase